MSVTLRTRKTKSKGTIYYMDVVWDGRRKKISLRTDNLQEAKRIASRMEQDLRLNGWPNGPSRQIKLAAFVSEYLTHGRATKAVPTVKLDEHALGQLLKFNGDVRLDSITQRDIEAFKVHRLEQIKPVSVNAELRHIKAAFSFAIDIEILKTNPAQRVRLCKVAKTKSGKFLDREQIARLKKACETDPGLFRMVEFTLATGLRRGEIASLQWRDIDFNRKMILVQNKESFRTKSGKDRQVPMSKPVEKMLREMQKTEPDLKERVFEYNYWWFGKKFKRAVDEARLPESTTIHTLRHTFASHLVMQGVDLRSVKELLGHADISTTMVYSHLSPDHLADTVERIPY